MVCGEALTYRERYGWAHAGGNIYVMRCDACGWKGSPYPPPSPKLCPRCHRDTVRDDHAAQPRFS